MFQGIINIKDKIIIEKIFSPDSVEITINDSRYEFPDAWIYPGFIDSHCHLLGLGNKLLGLTLDNETSEQNCIDCVLNYKKLYLTNEAPSKWILGRGWNQELWQNNQLPSKLTLDFHFPDTPVCLTRVDGHAAWVNSTALKLAGIDKYTENPIGGIIHRDRNNEPTGILIDNALNIINAIIPKLSSDTLLRSFSVAMDECARIGLTEIYDMDFNINHVPILLDMAEDKELNIRINTFIKTTDGKWKDSDVRPLFSSYFNILGVKFYVDGALGSYGAALSLPYSDNQSTLGLIVVDPETYENDLFYACRKGFAIATHAIGNAAVKFVLHHYIKLRKKGFTNILRIEHAQLLDPEDLQLFKDYCISPSVQPVHYVSDFEMAKKRLGTNRNILAYPWKSFLNNNIIFSSGSDFPIETHNPLHGIEALVRRQPSDSHQEQINPEILCIEDAIKTYTLYPSMIHKYSSKRGSLNIGLAADLTILDANLSTIKSSDISKARVLATFCNGKPTYISN
ncbi:MAG: amidohydrolase [Candidatus Kapabacteria bacterium]|nr:amidohydrolase [Candidatus Kapabacteria bacterium]